MGKGKKHDEDLAGSVVVELKPVVAMKPEQREKWLKKAVKAVSTGSVKPGQLYDVLMNRKVIQGVPDKVGQRMKRILQGQISLFSDKQQRFLLAESPLVMQFKIDAGDHSDEDIGHEARAGRREGAADAVTQSTTKRQRAEDEAAKMEEMMARCRNFVRENANTYEERERQVEQQVKEAEELQRREAQARLEEEWRQIAAWHATLETWEHAQFAAEDKPEHRQGEDKAKEATQGKEKTPARKGSSSSSSGSGRSKAKASKVEVENVRGSQRDRSKARTSKAESERDSQRDRERKKGRDRDRSRSRSRDRSRNRDRSRTRNRARSRDRSRDRDRGRDRGRGRRRRSSSS